MSSSGSTTCKIDIGQLKGKENWATWRYKVIQLLRGSQGGLSAVEGKLAKPIHPGSAATTEKVATYEKETQHYNEVDSHAVLLLTANMTDETLQKIMRLQNAQEIWDELHRLFDSSSDDRTYTYSLDFYHYCKDPTHDMATHISRVKNLWHDLKTELMKEYKCDLPDVLLICKILDTLPEDYFSFKSTWLLMSKSDRNIENLTAQLCHFEKSLAIGNSNGNSDVLTVQPNQNKKFSKIKCGYCGKPGHKVKRCQKWISDGRPPKASTTSKANLTIITAESHQALKKAAVSKTNTESWYVDNGATVHVTGRRDYFTTFESFEDSTTDYTLTTANGAVVKVIGRGTVDLIAYVHKEKQDIRLNNVWYVPGVTKNLFSVLAAQDTLENSEFTSERESCWLKEKGKVLLMGKRSKNGGLYELLAKTIVNKAASNIEANAMTNLQLYHERFAHQNKRHVKKVIEKELGIKVKLDSELCTGCVYGKTHRRKFGTRAQAKEPGEILHTDVCGPFPPSFGKNRYFVLFKDDYSKYRYVYVMRNKSEVADKLVQVLKEIKTRGHIVKEIYSDNGGEFDNARLKQILQNAGITQRLTMPYTPEQNGTSERENRTLVEAARSMMHSHVELPIALWCELISTATYVLNRTGPTCIDGKSPYELWYRRKPGIKHLRVIGSECYAHVPKQKRKKLAKKAQKCILIGYEGDEGYRLVSFDKCGKPTLIRSRDVIFNESIIESIGLNDEIEPESDNEIEYRLPSIKENGQVSRAREDEPSEAIQPPIDMSGAREDEQDEVNRPSICMPQTSQDFPDSTDEVPQIDNEEQERYDTPYDSEEEESVDRVLRDRSQLRPPARYGDFVLNLGFFVEPKTYKEALTSSQKEKWLKAMESEMKSLSETKTWILVDLPKGRKPISCKWIYKVKTNADGSLDKFKARLVARGFTQKEGVDFYETFSPVAKLATVKLIIKIAVDEDLALTQFDVATAFLNGSLDEDIYMNQPEGYSDGTNKVCKLLRSLYGLKQAPRCWNRCIVDYLISIGFKQCQNDPCLFVRVKQGAKIILALYVDDGLIAAANPKDSERFLAELKRRFRITVKPASYYIGMEILKHENGIKLTQKHYAEKLLERFGMHECKSVSTPIIKDATAQPTATEEQLKFPYREAVGALMYLMTGSRPDLSYAISVVSRNLENPSREDVTKVKRIFRYIKGTVDYGLIYRKGNKGLLCYSDSDHGGDKQTGRSTSGILCTYSGGIISWASRRQTCVAISSTEAELVAASETAREMIWLKRLIIEVSQLNGTPSLMVDNDAAIKISQNPELHRRTKHIALRHFYIRELVTNKEVQVKYTPTEYQYADMLTKPVSGPRLLVHLKKIGLMSTD